MNNKSNLSFGIAPGCGESGNAIGSAVAKFEEKH